ncbi:hypothetical protein LTR53_004221 [Teratosphaeriaceae sp. CCFEE 6253]|nr:hypothetical protein LTR53_004221 [Teratosphaeriaceae sp. CCFEE 6253]
MQNTACGTLRRSARNASRLTVPGNRAADDGLAVEDADAPFSASTNTRQRGGRRASAAGPTNATTAPPLGSLGGLNSQGKRRQTDTDDSPGSDGRARKRVRGHEREVGEGEERGNGKDDALDLAEVTDVGSLGVLNRRAPADAADAADATDATDATDAADAADAADATDAAGVDVLLWKVTDPQTGETNGFGSARIDNTAIQGVVQVTFGEPQSFDRQPHLRSIAAEVSFDDESIGEILLYIVRKKNVGPSGGKGYVYHLLRQQAPHPLHELSEGLIQLWDTNGKLRKVARPHEDELTADTVVWLNLLRLRPEWEGKGLGSVAMRVMHAVLRAHLAVDLPAIILLHPDKVAEPDEVVTPEQRGAHQKRLIKFYGSLGYAQRLGDEEAPLPQYMLWSMKVK